MASSATQSLERSYIQLESGVEQKIKFCYSARSSQFFSLVLRNNLAMRQFITDLVESSTIPALLSY